MFHSCSTMKDGKKTLIVVAGGNSGPYLDSVEIYDPTDNTWHSGKNQGVKTKSQAQKYFLFIYYFQIKINQNAYCIVSTIILSRTLKY